MTILLTAIIVGTGFLALYWIFHGQRKYNDMFMPKRKTELKAVLFDMDGVIIDSFEAWFSVFNQVRKDLKLKEIKRDEFKSKVWGGSVSRDAKNYFKNADVKEIEQKYQKLITEHVEATKLMDDAENVLKEIKKKNIKIGLVTNTFREPAMAALKQHKINNYFDVIITADDSEKLKPYPDPVIKLCEKLDVMPDETILVGDTKNDYKAGKSAGCTVVGLNTHGDLMISRLKDLLELV